MADERDTIDITSRIAERDKPTDGPPFGLRKRQTHEKHKHCIHPRSTVDFEARVIECRRCGEVLDPWHVLKTLVEAFESGWKWRSWASSLAVERDRLHDEVAALKRERSRVRAALKREGVRLRKLRREQAVKGGSVTEIGS